jgi:cytochrome bd-type quinol oxidase subunit 2
MNLAVQVLPRIDECGSELGCGAEIFDISNQFQGRTTSMKTVIAILLTAVIISLGSALFSMKNPQDHSAQMLRTLTVRVVLSIGLVIVLLLSWKLGLVEPHADG